jgi:hypothetical protein
MEKFLYKWRLLLRRILIALSFGTITACFIVEPGGAYGMPPDYPPVPTAFLDGRVLAADTRLAIPGIQVTIEKTGATTKTSSRGYFYFNFRGEQQVENAKSGTLALKDIDGAENGEFKDASIDWDENNSLPYDIFMEPKE